MRVVFVSSESTPFVKTGGLGEVVGSLAKCNKEINNEINVIIPAYKSIKDRINPERTIRSKVFFESNWREFDIHQVCEGGINFFLIDCANYFDRDYIYSPPEKDVWDNPLRFGFFSLASLQTIVEFNLSPEIIHIHDWHTSLLPLYKNLYYPSLKTSATVLTIHNIAYQGVFDSSFLPLLNLPWDIYKPYDGIEFYGRLNFLKAGIIFSDAVTTVSPAHSEEIKSDSGFGLEGVIRQKKYFFGILNGIDTDYWNPEKDQHLIKNYRFRNYKAGKRKNKEEIKRIFGIDTPIIRPLVVFIGRLTYQKGLDLVVPVIEELIIEGFDFIFLGSGEEHYQDKLMAIIRKYPRNVSARIEYDERIAHLAYAGADIFLMPSIYEPCGLAQMIAMRYGAVPVVRRTGGLADTVRDFFEHHHSGNGFSFRSSTSQELMLSLLKAMSIYYQNFFNRSNRWDIIVSNCMSADYSWNRSIREYMKVYSIAKMLKK